MTELAEGERDSLLSLESVSEELRAACEMLCVGTTCGGDGVRCKCAVRGGIGLGDANSDTPFSNFARDCLPTPTHHQPNKQ